jgi:cell wall-associated NlpC family hydrolase
VLAVAFAVAAASFASPAVRQVESYATVAVPVANVWQVPGTATISNDFHLWPTPQVTYEQRIGLVGHLPTQVLYGERVIVLERDGAWSKIAVPDQPSQLDRRGYPGWMLTWQLRPAGTAANLVTVSVPRARLSTGTEVGFGTQLPLVRRSGKSLVVLTPTGVKAKLPASAARPLPRTRADLVRTAKQFLGLKYLWGGLSAWGYDCSGLTWAVYRAHGITIPRDADIQATAGRAITLEQAQPGDLIFYGVAGVHHVTMAVGNGMMVEAPNSASEVRIVPIRTDDLAGVRTVVPPDFRS